MFKVVSPEGGMKEVSFEQLNKMCGDTLDEIFFSEVFTEHVLEYDNKKVIVLGGSI